MAIKIMVGEFSGRRELRLRLLGWGRCYIERPVRPYADEPWIFDNGAFRWFKAGVDFQDDKFRARLERARATGHRPLFAVIPDVVAEGARSLAFSLQWLNSGELAPEWKWYLAVQDGMTTEDVEPLLERSDVAGLFIGGSDDFKATASQWTALAHNYGKRCHYGRASTPQKMAAAINSGCDSCDTAFILWQDTRFIQYAQAWVILTHQIKPKLEEWLRRGAPIQRPAPKRLKAA